MAKSNIKMNININFGGFYESLHDMIVEDKVAYAMDMLEIDGENDSDALYSIDSQLYDECNVVRLQCVEESIRDE